MANVWTQCLQDIGASPTVSWDFDALDQENEVDENGNIMVIAEERDGLFQQLKRRGQMICTSEHEPPSKRIRLEPDQDSTQSQDSAIDFPLLHPRHADAKPVTNGLVRGTDTGLVREIQHNAQGSRNLPFIVEDSSDEDSSSAPPPQTIRPQMSSSRAYLRLNAADEEASRLESRRLRLEAQGRRNCANAWKDRGTKSTDYTNSGRLESSETETRDPRSWTSRKSQSLAGVTAFEPSHKVDSNISHSTSRKDYAPRYAQPEATTASVRAPFNPDMHQHTKETDTSSVYTPHTARDPAEVKRELTQRLEAHPSTIINRNRIANGQSVHSAWKDAEIARRAAAAKARKESDAKKDAEWHEKQRQKRAEDLRMFQEKRRATTSLQDDFKKEHASHRSTRDVGTSALERLQQAHAARKAIPPVKAKPPNPGCVPPQSRKVAESNEAHVEKPSKQPQIRKDVAMSDNKTGHINWNRPRDASGKFCKSQLPEGQEKNAKLHTDNDTNRTPCSLNSVEGQKLLAACNTRVGAEPHVGTRNEATTSAHSISVDLKDVERIDPVTSPTKAPAYYERPQYAGKTWNPEAWVYYMDCLLDEWDLKDEHLTREDRCHFAFQVQKRQITTAQMEATETTVEAEDWITLGHVYDNLAEANAAASSAIISTLSEFEHVALENFTLERSTSEEGMAELQINGENGIAQTRVIRFIRTYDEGKFPTHGYSLIPRKLYVVMERTIKTKAGDGMFEESHKETVEKPLSKEVFSSLEMANERAVKRYVELGYSPTSGNLDERDREIRDMVAQVLHDVGGEEDDKFDRTLTSDDKTEEKNIWVEEQRLMGPRNLK